MKAILACLMLFTTNSVSQELPELPKLRIDQEKHITTKTGQIQVGAVLGLKVGDIVKLYLIDGTELSGKVFQRDEVQGKSIAVYGTVDAEPDAGFGLIMNNEGGFEGALLFKRSARTYLVSYIVESKSFYFLRAVKIDKNS